jgi:hypothetical protein
MYFRARSSAAVMHSQATIIRTGGSHTVFSAGTAPVSNGGALELFGGAPASGVIVVVASGGTASADDLRHHGVREFGTARPSALRSSVASSEFALCSLAQPLVIRDKKLQAVVGRLDHPLLGKKWHGHYVRYLWRDKFGKPNHERQCAGGFVRRDS